MAAKKGPLPLSESDFIEEVATRSGQPRSTVRDVVKALKVEAIDCLANGYKVSLSGLLTLEPQAKPGRKKGTVVRNPFDGSERTLRSDEPDKFKVKAKASSAIVKSFPGVKSKDGQALLAQLAKKTKKSSGKKGK